MRLQRQKARQLRGLAQTLWEMSDELNGTAQHVRYANRPSDLTLPIVKLLQMTRRLNMFRDQWMLLWIKDRPGETIQRWPRLFAESEA